MSATFFTPHVSTTFGRPDRCFCGAVVTRAECLASGEPLGLYCAAHDGDTPRLDAVPTPDYDRRGEVKQ
jgi:hypothetical protein